MSNTNTTATPPENVCLERIQYWRDSKELVSDPQLVAYDVRGWHLTKEAELTTLAWAMCRDGSVSKNDALFLLDELEKHIRGKLTDE